MSTTLKIFCLLLGCFCGNLIAGCLSIEGEFLYFQPLIDQPYFVWDLDSPTSLEGERKANTFDFSPGVRLEIDYQFCPCLNDLSLRWTYLDVGHSQTISGDRLILTNLDPDDFGGTVRSKYKLNYQALDFLYGWQLLSCPSQHALWLRAGLHGSYIDMHDKVTEFSADFSVFKNICQNYGIGPEIGLHGAYQIPCFPLTLSASVNGALVITHYDASLTVESDGVVFLDMDDEHFWRMVPYCDIRIGLGYVFCLRAFSAAIEAGYEALNYWNSIYTIRFPSAAILTNFNLYSNLGFHGPYINVRVDF